MDQTKNLQNWLTIGTGVGMFCFLTGTPHKRPVSEVTKEMKETFWALAILLFKR